MAKNTNFLHKSLTYPSGRSEVGSGLRSETWDHELHAKLLGLPHFLLPLTQGLETVPGAEGGKPGRCLGSRVLEPLLGQEDVCFGKTDQLLDAFCTQ